MSSLHPRQQGLLVSGSWRVLVVSHGGTLRVFRYLVERWTHDEFLEQLNRLSLSSSTPCVARAEEMMAQ